MRENAGYAYTLIKDPASDSLQNASDSTLYVNAAAAAYTNAYQARAAVALAQIGGKPTLPGCFFYPSGRVSLPVTCWEEAERILELLNE